MIIYDLPDLQYQTPPYVIMAQANQDQTNAHTRERTLGVCLGVKNRSVEGPDELPPPPVLLSPDHDAISYRQEFEQLNDATMDDPPAKVTILQQPKHGSLAPVPDTANVGSWWYYTPDKNYSGKDSASVLVEIKGVKIKVIYFFSVYPDIPQDDEKCTKNLWKISQSVNDNVHFAMGDVPYIGALNASQRDGKLAR
jgi:hypothetical protein